ncbi:MAG: hypothetical protein QM606_05000, partial [Leucobacter sp.]
VSETGVLGLAKGAQMYDRDGGLQSADGPQRLVSTPTVIVNGKQWDQSVDGDLESYLLKVKSEVEKDSSGSTGSGTDAETDADESTDPQPPEIVAPSEEEADSSDTSGSE